MNNHQVDFDADNICLFVFLVLNIVQWYWRCLQQEVMSYSLQKGRNYSKQNLHEKKHLAARHSEKQPLISLLQGSSVLQQRGGNKPHLMQTNGVKLRRRESQDNILKRQYQNTSLKPINSSFQMDSRYSNLNKRIKDILDNNSNNHSLVINKNQGDQTNSLAKSSVVLRRGSNVDLSLPKEQIEKQLQKQNILPNQSMYFLECLKRKNSITTEFYINIHTSILTFKQFYKVAQQSKPKLPDPSIPQQENPSNSFFISSDRKTIVFDMDETLIHTSEVITPGYEIKVPFKAFQGKITSGYVNVRPYAKELLKKLSKYFDIIIFTAGNKCYADPILDHIDPNNVILHRLYRESCTFVANQLFIKDLRIIGRPLQQVVLVDNAPHSYLLQLSNGIPILNYFKGKDDNQLFYLEKYLMSLLDVKDVRTVNEEYFKLEEYMKYESHDKLISALYGKKVGI